ncbi:MAG TPA: hypothetical protein VIP08_06410 [Phenylobacterium sp.]
MSVLHRSFSGGAKSGGGLAGRISVAFCDLIGRREQNGVTDCHIADGGMKIDALSGKSQLMHQD